VSGCTPRFSLYYFSRSERFSLSSCCLIWIVIAAPFTPWLVLWICLYPFVFGVVGCPGFHSVLWTLPLSLFGLRFMQVGARLRCFCCTARWFLCSIYGARASLVSVRFSCLPTAQFFCPHSLVLAAAGFGPRCLGFRVNKFGGRIKIRS
jgi:hypothetical protein